jgi:ribosomal protein L11 methyltransferase
MTKQTEKLWFALEISVSADASEAIEFALNELGALGTEINNLGKDKPRDHLLIVGYFNEKTANETVENQLREALRIYGFSFDVVREIVWRAIENKDWLAEWKKHWRPTETEKFIVAPTWENLENAKKIVIKIEPSMAFGTGTHETTKLCLRAIEENYAPEMSFLDVGTGTGILAIAAAKLKSEIENSSRTLATIFACDTDEDSIKIARENAAFNNVSGVEFHVGSISEETPAFDFVCANLTADVILPLLPQLVGKTKKILVLSGILIEQESLVVGELRSKFKHENSNLKIERDGEWISILMKNR